MTLGENDHTISVDFCPYFELLGHNITEPGFIILPSNLSELNDYKYRPMNRKGRVCSECTEGYGLSVTSFHIKCLDYLNAWYGILLYLLLELVPLTMLILLQLQ